MNYDELSQVVMNKNKLQREASTLRSYAESMRTQCSTTASIEDFLRSYSTYDLQRTKYPHVEELRRVLHELRDQIYHAVAQRMEIDAAQLELQASILQGVVEGALPDERKPVQPQDDNKE